MTTSPHTLPFLDLASPGFSTRSHAVAEARETNWCARTPYGLAVLRHKEAGLLLRDRRLRQGSHAWPDMNELRGSFADFWKRSIISQEGDQHRALRALAVPALSPDFINRLKPQFDQIAESLAAALKAKGRCEFMEDFAEPFAGQAICALLGMPVEDWPSISRDASDLGLAMGVECKRHQTTVNDACDRLMALADALIDRARTGRDTQSYIARLVENFDAQPALTHQHLKDMIVISIFGGVDTTRSQLGFAVALFIDHPDQWHHLRCKPALVANAIEEIIRTRPTTTWATREAIEDFTFQGQPIAQGETLHILVHASARDTAICDDPAFNITTRRKIHFGFGGGAHHCIGHLMARTDMACALKAMARHIASFAYAGTPQWLPDSGNTSPVCLPVRVN